MKGHARKVPHELNGAVERPLRYLPHHPVFQDQKPGKVRVVFDCAAGSGGISLNDQLLQGADLTNNLTGVLLRFRKESIALMADMEQMFHQVRVAPDHCHALRFLRWENRNLSQDPIDHQMLVPSFGATSSTCCASFILKKTANVYKSEYDVQAIDTVNRKFYLDDCLKSIASVPEATRLVSQLMDLLVRGAFHLTKCISNHREVLQAILSTKRAPSVANLDLEDLPIDRALQWRIKELGTV